MTNAPVIHAGTTVRLSTGRLMSVARVVVRDEDGHVTAAIDLLPYVDDAPPPPPWRAEPAERPSPWEPPPHASPNDRHSPPTARCHCRSVWDDAGRPRSHARSCPDYTLEDEAFCRTWYAWDTGRAPTYAEALASLRGGSSAPAATKAEIKARRMAGQRCGTCPQCRGLTSDSRCRHERVAVERDAVRRIYAHAQAINPAALDATSAHIYGLLVDEVGKLAAAAGIK